MIGLIDYDLQTSTSLKLVPPNIEIMKLATYYRQEENHFCRIMSLEETELTSYDKIYIFSEADEYPQLPEQFRRANNVILGGTAFTNGKYIPFKNEIIDFTLARTNIYHEFLKEKYAEGVKTKTLKHILDDSYYRMYAGNKRLPIPPILPRQRVYIYDRNIFVPDWQAIFQALLKRKPSSIQPIHPVICNTVTNYFDFRNSPKVAKDIDTIINFNIPLQDTSYLMKKYKHLFLADIRPSSNVFITLGGNFDTERQYIKDYIYKINLLFIFWSNKIPLKLKYIKPNIGYTDPISHLSQMTTTWSQGDTKITKSIKDRIYKDKKASEIRPERVEKDKIISLHPDAKTLFDQTL